MRALPLAVIAALLLTAPALAQPTARVTGGNIAVRTGPGMGYPTIGRLPNGSEVTLERCTRNDEWCFVTDTGWVLASYLVGWSAKIPVTPPTFGGPLFGPEYGFDFDW